MDPFRAGGNWRSRAFPALLLAAVTPARAVDAVVLINQDKALAGNITPGDAPGFPVRLTRSGSYRLTSNLNVGVNPNVHGITISAHDVTIDLNGFRIKGPTACSGTPLNCTPTGQGRGINAQTRRNVAVYNGSVVGMGLAGVLTGPESRIEHVAARSNGLVGIFAGESSTVTNSTASFNGNTGLAANVGSTVSGSTATQNGQFGINVGNGSSVVACSASSNGSRGIGAAQGSMVLGSAATKNQDFGISAEEGSAVIANASSFNVSGILARSGSTVTGNAATGNTGTTDRGDGIATGDGVTVFANAAASNGRRGISAENQSTVFGNTAINNKEHGINVNAGLVMGNTSASNAGLGFTGSFSSGLASNVFNLNNGGTQAPQTSGGVQIEANLCFDDTVCP